MFGAVLDVYAEQGVEGVVRHGSEYTLLRSRIASPWTKTLYWRVAPWYLRWVYPTDFDEYAASPDPFKIERVDPARIQRFTRRCYPPWRNRHQLFGSVKDGEWDRRPIDETPHYDGPPENLFHAERIDESSLHEALRAHFRGGVPWTETEFVSDVIAFLDEGVEWVWHDCRTRSDVLERCERLEDVYRSMNRNGYLSYFERTAPQDREGNYIDALEHEIVVDVGRDGELLLVSGKHRLCIAKILDLDTVLTTFLVRHREWMDRRRSIWNGDSEVFDHPDLRDLS